MVTRPSRIQLTAKDVCEALNVPRHTLRRWVESLSPFLEADIRARSARRYDAGDLLFFAVVQQLETQYGLRLGALQRISDSMLDFLKGPRTMVRFVFIYLQSGQLEPLGNGIPLQAGFVVDLDPAYRLVAHYLDWPDDSGQLPLGLVGLR